MSPFQAESLLTEFLLAQGNFAEEAPSELLRLSQDARNSAKERGVRSTPPPKPGWVNPGQILQWVEDRSPQDPVIDYEKQRRAARFVSHARIPGNPLPPFHRVKDHIAAFRKKEPGAVSPEPISKPRPRTAVKPPQAETPKQPPPKTEEEIEPVLMIEPEGLDETLLEPLELDEEGSVEEEVQLAVPKETESEETPQEAKSNLKSDAEKSGDPVEEEEELEEKPVKKKAQPTTAQLLDFDDEEEEDFDDEDGLSAEETDETDVVFGTGPITQPSMIKFMHQYPDSVLKFLLRRNLDGRPLPGEFEKIYDQWQQRGLMRGRLKRHLLKMMEWEEIPDTPIHELVGQIRNRILDLRLEQD